jgi:hypothetical protein
MARTETRWRAVCLGAVRGRPFWRLSAHRDARNSHRPALSVQGMALGCPTMTPYRVTPQDPPEAVDVEVTRSARRSTSSASLRTGGEATGESFPRW